MSRPQIITIDDIKYYNANDLKKFDPVYFFGCSRTIRTIIKKKNINIANIAFGNDNVRLGWRLSSDQSKPPSKAKLLLVERWVLENVRRAKNKLQCIAIYFLRRRTPFNKFATRCNFINGVPKMMKVIEYEDIKDKEEIKEDIKNEDIKNEVVKKIIKKKKSVNEKTIENVIVKTEKMYDIQKLLIS